MTATSARMFSEKISEFSINYTTPRYRRSSNTNSSVLIWSKTIHRLNKQAIIEQIIWSKEYNFLSDFLFRNYNLSR